MKNSKRTRKTASQRTHCPKISKYAAKKIREAEAEAKLHEQKAKK